MRRRLPILCRFLDAGMTTLPRAVAAGVQKAPRHEVAGSWAPVVQRALWGFDGGAGLEGGCKTDRMRPADQPTGEMEAYSRHLSKRLKRIKERTARRPRRPGREGSLPAWGQRIGTGKWRRSRAVWLMMCRSCSASDATSARSRVRTPQSRSCGRHSADKGKAAHVACPRRYPVALAGRWQAGRR